MASASRSSVLSDALGGTGSEFDFGTGSGASSFSGTAGSSESGFNVCFMFRFLGDSVNSDSGSDSW